MTDALLDEVTVLAWLRSMDVIGDGPAGARLLAGGVSNVVIAVDAGVRRLIVKQALAQLRVQDRWEAPRERTIVEGAALELCGTITPDAVPEVLLCDEPTSTLVTAMAPHGTTDWKAALFDGRLDPAVARAAGRVLGTWQRATEGGRGIPPVIRQADAFEQLRLAPYYDASAERIPEHAESILTLRDELAATARVLVHGDFSPKNLLVVPDGIWVIDFEVAHVGHPVFDPAFLLTHLVLKSIAGIAPPEFLNACAREFLDARATAAGAELALDDRTLARHVGGLLLARVHGKSPAEYLDDAGRARTASFAEQLLGAADAADPRTLPGLAREELR